MSDATATALLAAVPPTLVALGALVVGIITAIRSTRTIKKVDAVAVQAQEIVHATNGTLSRLTADNKVLIERMEGLERALAASQASGVEAASVAVQSAQDVQAALASPPPGEGG